jgi:hypothetical protein
VTRQVLFIGFCTDVAESFWFSIRSFFTRTRYGRTWRHKLGERSFLHFFPDSSRVPRYKARVFLSRSIDVFGRKSADGKGKKMLWSHKEPYPYLALVFRKYNTASCNARTRYNNYYWIAVHKHFLRTTANGSARCVNNKPRSFVASWQLSDFKNSTSPVFSAALSYLAALNKITIQNEK